MGTVIINFVKHLTRSFTNTKTSLQVKCAFLFLILAFEIDKAQMLKKIPGRTRKYIYIA